MFDAGRGPERDVCLLREVVERAVGVAQDDKGCVIPDLSDSQQVRCGMRAQEAHVFVQPCTVCACVSLQEHMREALCAVKEVIDGSCLDQLQIRTILVKVWCAVVCCGVV